MSRGSTTPAVLPIFERAETKESSVESAIVVQPRPRVAKEKAQKSTSEMYRDWNNGKYAGQEQDNKVISKEEEEFEDSQEEKKRKGSQERDTVKHTPVPTSPGGADRSGSPASLSARLPKYIEATITEGELIAAVRRAFKKEVDMTKLRSQEKVGV